MGRGLQTQLGGTLGRGRPCEERGEVLRDGTDPGVVPGTDRSTELLLEQRGSSVHSLKVAAVASKIDVDAEQAQPAASRRGIAQITMVPPQIGPVELEGVAARAVAVAAAYTDIVDGQREIRGKNDLHI